MTIDDPFALSRFVDAQRGAWEGALAELRRGRKVGHWMWFVFPQIAGLGASPRARRYAIASLDEARAYLRHPVLGPRLVACVEAVNQTEGRDAHAIFGSPDDLKFRSSLTLFAAASPGESAFKEALQEFFDGESDPLTLGRLEST